MRRSSLAALSVALVLLVLLGLVSAYMEDKVLLTDLSALTLTKGQLTKARRTSPIPQLQCVGGSAQYSNYHPSVVQCRNVGSDGHDVQWECKAELDEAVKFGPVTVSCEGYAHPDDPYVLRGSCGLEYSLEYTRKGDLTFFQGNYQRYDSGSGYTYDYNYSSSSGGGWGTFFLFIFFVVIIFFTLKLLCGPNDVHVAPAGPPSSVATHGSGENPGGYGAPPPGGPYYGGGGPASPYGGSYGPSYTAPAPAPAPGFWSGLTAGGILGYMMRPRAYGYGGYGYGAPAYVPTYGGATRPSGSGGGSGGSRTASGFGGTRRR